MSQDLEPHVNLNLEHEAAIFQQSLTPDTLYRLRLSVLKDNNGNVDYPSQMFVCAPISFIIYLLHNILTNCDYRLSHPLPNSKRQLGLLQGDLAAAFLHIN